jgi:hypothetical protein
MLLVFAGWINRHQQAVIEYLQAANQSLREQVGNKRTRECGEHECWSRSHSETRTGWGTPQLLLSRRGLIRLDRVSAHNREGF